MPQYSTTLVVLCLLLQLHFALSLASQEQWKHYDHYSLDGALWRHVALDDKTGHVYVCNEDTLCHLDQGV